MLSVDFAGSLRAINLRVSQKQLRVFVWGGSFWPPGGQLRRCHFNGLSVKLIMEAMG